MNNPYVDLVSLWVQFQFLDESLSPLNLKFPGRVKKSQSVFRAIMYVEDGGVCAEASTHYVPSRSHNSCSSYYQSTPTKVQAKGDASRK